MAVISPSFCFSYASLSLLIQQLTITIFLEMEEVERCIQQNISWDNLNNKVKSLLGTKSNYDQEIRDYSIKHQLRYRGNIGE